MFEKIQEKYRYYRTLVEEFYQRIFRPSENLSRIDKIVKYSISAYKTNASSEVGFKCAALVYYTAFAIVPALALIFSVTDGLGFDNALDYLASFVLTDTPGILNTVFDIARGAKMDATSGLVTTISSLILLWSVWTLMERVSTVFKDIWKNQITPDEERPFKTRLISRLLLLFLSPFVIIIMYAGVTQITFIEAFFIRKMGLPEFFNVFNYLIMYGATALVFSAMYKYIPSVKVKYRHALVSGAVAAVLFAAFQLFYIFVQSKVSRYNLVYGALAALPLFLVWAYYSWELIIKGAVLCHTLEYPEEYNSPEQVKPEPTAVESIKDKIIKDVKTLHTDISTAVGTKIQDMKDKREQRKNKR